jgi:3-oxoadipate enol-lactonase
MPIVELESSSLYYEIEGSGPPLLVINGTGSDLRRPTRPFDWSGSDRFELLSYDHRGLGRSVPHDLDEQPTMADFGGDALALVDQLGWDTFSVLGISFGGMVAQHLALRAGARVEHLVLACTSCGGAGGASYPLNLLYALSPSARVDAMVPLVDTRAADDAGLRDLLTAYMGAGLEDAVPVGLTRQLEARRHHDTHDRLASIVAPTLVAAGRYDGIAPLANSEVLAELIPDARLAVFDGGHGFMLQDPTAWPAMADFILGSDARR